MNKHRQWLSINLRVCHIRNTHGIKKQQAHQMVPNAKNLDLKNLKINLHVCQTSQSLGLFLSNWDGKHVTNTGRMRKILEYLGTFIPFHTADQNPHKHKIIQIYLLPVVPHKAVAEVSKIGNL
jgi:hypothetical protein